MSDTPPMNRTPEDTALVIAHESGVNPAEVSNVLAALTEWADGGLIDPSTWTVVEATERGVDYCTEHHGVRNEDEDACDFSECGGSECVLAPLHTLSPREGEHERCPAGICRRGAGHAGPHSDLPCGGGR
jgi:hypothetical protein